MGYDPLNPDTDPFRPPDIPTEVACLHCGREYESYRIEWRVETGDDGTRHGYWCCPTPGCDGRGFGFDLLPTDPEYRDERGGWVWIDDEEDDDLMEDEELPEQDGGDDGGPPEADGEEQIPW
jgi:hypothetical protein